MNNSEQLPETEKDYDLIGYIRFPKPKPSPSQENPRKVPQWYFGEKADSSGKFSEKKLIFLVGFIFMICLANLITTGILIYFFLENLQ